MLEASFQEKCENLGFAKIDLSRGARTGLDETVFCPGKSKEQLSEIFKAFRKNGLDALGSKCSQEQFDYLTATGIPASYDPVSQVVSLRSKAIKAMPGKIAVCCAGTADLPIAEEAAQVAEFAGAKVERFFDVGVAGLHRLLAELENIRSADVVIAVAGMEGALAGVIAGLVKSPVVAVPTSVGYGSSFRGIAPLLTMLNTCAEGVSVVNIDNGFGAAVFACRILRQMDKNDER